MFLFYFLFHFFFLAIRCSSSYIRLSPSRHMLTMYVWCVQCALHAHTQTHIPCRRTSFYHLRPNANARSRGHNNIHQKANKWKLFQIARPSIHIERKIHEPWTFSFKCAQIFRYDAGPTPPDAYSIILYYYALFFIFIAAANCHTVTLLRAAHHSYQCLESVSVVYIRSFRVGGSISICLLRY